MSTSWFLLGFIIYLTALCDGTFIIDNGIKRLDLFHMKQCSPRTITCRCSTGNYPISVPIPICKDRVSFWFFLCRPCNGLRPEDLCPKYKNCYQCYTNGGNHCVTCPIGKFGTWCTNTCNCQNGGTCGGSGNCKCPASHEGVKCEKKKYFCTCQNGGRCDYSGNCICPPSHEGKHCEKKKVFCTCQNGGRCDYSGNCICPPSHKGKHCEKKKVTCTCQNGGRCDSSGICICNPSHEGKHCEKKKGCKKPTITPPLQAVFHPPDQPVTAVYSCPSGYVLSGQAVSTCVSYKWSSAVPMCSPKCPNLTSPANVRLTFSGSDLVEGVTAEVNCAEGFRIINGGQKTLTCLASGKWDYELPLCEQMAWCPDPGNVKYAERTIISGSVKLGLFSEDSKIQYSCKAGFEQMGVSDILCTFEGSWSNPLPRCNYVATIVPDCLTSGSDIVAEEGIPVRIKCPPGCCDSELKLWGTSIYRIRSSVCQAAMHSAQITDRGGFVIVVNNGKYSHFIGSISNKIESDSFPDTDESFLFGKLKQQSVPHNLNVDAYAHLDPQPINLVRVSVQDSKNNISYFDRNESFLFDDLFPDSLTDDLDECENGLTKLEDACVYVSNNRRTYQEAEAVCHNLGLHLEIPEDMDEINRLATMLGEKGIGSIWVYTSVNFLNTSENDENVSHISMLQNSSCLVAAQKDLDFRIEFRRCKDVLNYVCIKKTDVSEFAYPPIPIGSFDPYILSLETLPDQESAVFTTKNMSYPDKDESSSFDNFIPDSLTDDLDECEDGLTKLQNTCVYVSNLQRNYQEANAVCENLGLHLELLEDSDDVHEVTTMLNERGIESIWADKIFQNFFENDENVTNIAMGEKSFCPVAVTEELFFRLERRECKEKLNYVCIKKMKSKITKRSASKLGYWMGFE